MGLALDVGLGGFALVVEGIEVLFETGVRRHAGVDGPSEPRLLALRRHSAAPLGRKATDLAAWAALAVILAGDLRPDRNPKKRWPFQLVPVIALEPRSPKLTKSPRSAPKPCSPTPLIGSPSTS